MIAWRRVVLIGCLAYASGGCLSVETPRSVDVQVGGKAEPVDSSRVPATSSHEQARAELRQAYDYIQRLERESVRLKEKRDEYKRERDDCRKRLERFEND